MITQPMGKTITEVRFPAGYLYGKLLRGVRVPGLSLGFCQYLPGYRIPRHAHEHARFVFTLRGSFTERYEQATRQCRSQSVIFRPPGERHEECFHGEGAQCLSVEVEPHWMQCLKEYGVVLNQSADFSGGFISQLGIRLYREFEGGDGFSALAMEGIMIEIAAEASRLRSPARESRTSPWLRRVRELLQTRFAEPLGLELLAKAANVHPVHVARGFRKAFGCTVGEYVRQLRVEFARHQIEEAKEPLAAIAVAAGFVDQSHLTRTFRRHMGITPAKYRALSGRRLGPYQKDLAIQDAGAAHR